LNNIEFATAIHILTLLVNMGDNLSSTYIAGSININPAMVRKTLSVLRTHGLIATKEGNGGGSSLAKPARNILISDIYLAVNNTSLLGKLNRPNPECKTGNQINGQLTELYKQADNALINKLSTVTLADFCKNFK
jgi:Rrf2 family protein